MQWYIKVLKKYAMFTGRASRQEYWIFMLIHYLILLGLNIAQDLILTAIEKQITVAYLFFPILSFLNSAYPLAVLIPHIAVNIRRMHDTGRNGWWCCVPIVNLIFAIEDGQPRENKYGADPKQWKNYL
jgi:uncharacterized membrane protein YhaH (DUF805 family)